MYLFNVFVYLLTYNVCRVVVAYMPLIDCGLSICGEKDKVHCVRVVAVRAAEGAINMRHN